MNLTIWKTLGLWITAGALGLQGCVFGFGCQAYSAPARPAILVEAGLFGKRAEISSDFTGKLKNLHLDPATGTFSLDELEISSDVSTPMLANVEQLKVNVMQMEQIANQTRAVADAIRAVGEAATPWANVAGTMMGGGSGGEGSDVTGPLPGLPALNLGSIATWLQSPAGQAFLSSPAGAALLERLGAPAASGSATPPTLLSPAGGGGGASAPPPLDRHARCRDPEAPAGTLICEVDESDGLTQVELECIHDRMWSEPEFRALFGKYEQRIQDEVCPRPMPTEQ